MAKMVGHLTGSLINKSKFKILGALALNIGLWLAAFTGLSYWLLKA